MDFVTYENRRNPHVTIHRAKCNQIGKNGGQHKHGQGEYRRHATFDLASQYARGTELPIIICSFCKPEPSGSAEPLDEVVATDREASVELVEYFFYNTDARAFTEQPLPRFPILIERGFAAVGGDRQQFGEQFSQLSPSDILLMYENGVGVVAVGRVRKHWDGVSHSVPLYYALAEMEGLTGGPFEYRIPVEWFLDLRAAPVSLDTLRARLGYTPRGAIQRVVERRPEISRLIEELQASQSLLPGEIARPNLYIEGATIQVSVNRHERSRTAVTACKAAHGTACVVCGFDFGATYGAEFSGFIHVHHLRPLSEVSVEYVVDPVADLRPVCPNCHAAIHHGGRSRRIEEVRQLLDKQMSN